MKVCKKCKGVNHSSAYRCRFCNTLFPGGQKLVAQRRVNVKNIDDKKEIWNAAVILYVVGGIFTLIGLFSSVFSISRGYGFLYHLPLLIGVAFIALAVWSKTEEYWSILIGFLLYSIVGLFSILATSFSVFVMIFFLAFEIYLVLALFKIKRKQKSNSKDILDA